jgi:hypothetical protein
MSGILLLIPGWGYAGIILTTQGKIIGEGNDAQKVYDEFSEFCEDRSRELGFEIKTGKQGVKDLTASIENEKAKAESLNAKIEELSSGISVDEADLKAGLYLDSDLFVFSVLL